MSPISSLNIDGFVLRENIRRTGRGHFVRSFPSVPSRKVILGINLHLPSWEADHRPPHHNLLSGLTRTSGQI